MKPLIKKRKLNLRKPLKMAGGFGKMLKIRLMSFVRLVLEVFSEFVFGFIYRGKGEALPPIKDLLILESAHSLAAKIRARKLRCVDVVSAYVERIREVNPLLNAMVDDRFDEAMRDAEVVDRLVSSGTKTEQQLEAETPFLGVPFTTKDCFRCKGLHNTFGLVVRRHVVADEDAAAITLMKNAGAILVGVTNTSEVCMWYESNNKVYGRTCNPYDTTRTCGGSSGGEGSLISGAGSVIGIGSDVGGSIRIPAFFNGVFGHKGTRGLVPNDGQFLAPEGGIVNYLSTGPICRYASDLLPMLKVLAKDKLDEVRLDDPVDVSKLRFFYVENGIQSPLVSKVHPELKNAMKKVVVHLEKAYGIKAQRVDFKELSLAGAIWSAKMSTDSSVSFSTLLADCQGEVNVVLEILKWFGFCSNHTFPALMLCAFEKVLGFDPDHLSMLYGKCELLSSRIQELLGDDGVLLFPPLPRPAPYHNQPIFTPFNYHNTAIFNSLGLPVTQCPLGLSSEGLPLGVQVVGNLFCDRLTLAVAVELERAFGGWRSPSQIP